jgi:type I restriction enzyme S subunit
VIADLKTYPAYKDSGVEWMGAIPEGWEVRRLGSITTPVSRRGRSDLPLLSVLRDKGVIRREEGDGNHNVVPEDLTNYKIVEPGDLVINKMKAWQGSLGVAAMDGIVSPAYFVYRLRVAERRYAHVLLRSRPYVGAFTAASSGVRVDQWDLSPVGMKAIPILVPSRGEQAAIVRFLDHVDSRIQRFIAVKERLIELLEEEKQAIIHRAVTRGLDPNVPLKPSGVDWLGDVPEHWEVVDMGRFIDLLPGFAFPSGGFSSGAEDTRLLRGVNVAPGEVRWDEVVRWPEEQQDSLDRYRLEIGDLVLGLDRPVISTGTRIARVTEKDTPSLLLQRVARIRTLSGLLPGFAHLLLGGEVFRSYMTPIFTGISVPHLSPEQVKNFRIGLPPLGEQKEIIDRVSTDAEGVDAVVAAAQRHITLLHEFRTRLISDAVTGKLDVREAAERFPNGPDAADAALGEQREEVVA